MLVFYVMEVHFTLGRLVNNSGRAGGIVGSNERDVSLKGESHKWMIENSLWPQLEGVDTDGCRLPQNQVFD